MSKLIKILITFCLTALPFKSNSQEFKPKIINKFLPDTIKESSALLWYKEKLWTLNDGGNPACIYALDSNAKKVLQTVCIKGASNIDWEALAMDKNFFYIGDFGNNKGNRNIFNIYKVKKDIPEEELSIVDCETITFSYKNFKSANFKSYSQWDAEALVCIHDTLVLFSKNWEGPNCNVYFLPTTPGNYEIDAAKKIYLDGLVTDASYDERTQSLILIGYQDFVPFVFEFKDFQLGNINLKKAHRHNFQKLIGVQAEGITFINDSTLLFSSEYNPATPGSLYKMQIPLK